MERDRASISMLMVAIKQTGRHGRWRGCGAELDPWLDLVLPKLNHAARRAICPHCVVGVVGIGKRQSMQPTAVRQGGLSSDRVQHSISIGRCDNAPVTRMLLVKTDRRVSRRNAMLVSDDVLLKKGPLGRDGAAIPPIVAQDGSNLKR